jgi:hypothetical protein
MIFIAILDPKYGDTSIFILCDNARNNHEPLGTTFAVSVRHLLTAYHNLATKPKQKIYSIASSLLKGHTNRYCGVRVHAINKEMDWAVLELFDTNPIELVPIPVSLRDPLEREMRLKVYICPVALYNNGGTSAMTSVPHWVQYWNSTDHHIVTSNGMYSGSSGAPYILPSGEVVAIHVYMDNQAETIDATIVQVPEEYSQSGIQDIVDIISNTTNSNVRVAGAQNSGLKISRCSQLVNLLRSLGIV